MSERDRDLGPDATRRLQRMVAAMPSHSAPDLAMARARRRLGWLPRLAGGLAVLLLVTTVVGVGLLVTGRLPLPGAVSARDGSFHGGGLRFEYPKEWNVYPSSMVGTMGSVFAVMGTADVGSCAGLGGIDPNCAFATPLGPGTLRLVVGTGAMPGYSILDHEPPGGWQLFVDGLPAYVEETGPNTADASDLSLSWTIARPGSLDNVYTLEAALRGPGVVEMRAQLDALVASIRFDEQPVALPTGAGGEAAAAQAVRTALDSIDRSVREYWSDWYACFPREPNTSRDGVVHAGPGNVGGQLAEPLAVTCTTSVTATAMQLWQVTLQASWPAGDGYPAGSAQEELYVTAHGETAGDWISDLGSDSPLAVWPPTPSPRAGPVQLQVGGLARMIDPSGTLYLTPEFGGDMLSGVPASQRMYVVSGPRTINGTDWYLVQWPPARSHVPVLGWLPAKVGARPEAESVAPACPANPSLDDLVAMGWGERLLCFGNQSITLTRVVAGDEAADIEVQGEPAWLAVDSSLRLYDEDGPSGLGGSMPVHLDPSSGIDVATGTLLDVTGHFDDPAAMGCSRGFVGDDASSLVPEDSDAQVLRCRENFVVTQVQPAS
jgi:hypothetical protein